MKPVRSASGYSDDILAIDHLFKKKQHWTVSDAATLKQHVSIRCHPRLRCQRSPEINENLPFMVRQDELRHSRNSWELAFFEGFGKEERRRQNARAEGVVSTRERKHRELAD